jgi:hypothetical protein
LIASASDHPDAELVEITECLVSGTAKKLAFRVRGLLGAALRLG